MYPKNGYILMLTGESRTQDRDRILRVDNVDCLVGISTFETRVARASDAYGAINGRAQTAC